MDEVYRKCNLDFCWSDGKNGELSHLDIFMEGGGLINEHELKRMMHLYNRSVDESRQTSASLQKKKETCAEGRG